MNLPLTARALIAAQMPGAVRYRVFVQLPSGQWDGVREADPMHCKAVQAAKRHGWDGIGVRELTNQGGVKFRVLEDK